MPYFTPVHWGNGEGSIRSTVKRSNSSKTAHPHPHALGLTSLQLVLVFIVAFESET